MFFSSLRLLVFFFFSNSSIDLLKLKRHPPVGKARMDELLVDDTLDTLKAAGTTGDDKVGADGIDIHSSGRHNCTVKAKVPLEVAEVERGRIDESAETKHFTNG